MVVVSSRIPDARVGMLVSDGLEAGEGIGEYTDPFMVLECCESCMYGMSSARMMVRVSSVLAASIYMVVEVGMCTTAARNLG